ncbi:hypothetical protein VE03_10607, partial [Pseudogymnoascus sp. 23342-1-I1]
MPIDNMFKALLFASVLPFQYVVAHPGHEQAELQHAYDKRDFIARTSNDLAGCASTLVKNGITARAATRRNARALQESERVMKAKRKRDTTTVLNKSHLSSLTGVTASTDYTTLFGTSPTCLLAPEGEVGPYWVKGEYIRDDIRESGAGVTVIVEAQFIDVTSCEPITDLYWDVWNASPVGVYSGVELASDSTNIDSTALRGIVATDSEGVASITTLFPGHYSGRTNHIHVLAHLNAQVLSNGTLSGGTIPHTGQLFFDQTLINEVETTTPYSSNTNSITTNADDRVFATETANTNSDPVFEYVLLGDDVSDGIFAWINIGINPSASYSASYAATLTENGGVTVVAPLLGPITSGFVTPVLGWRWTFWIGLILIGTCGPAVLYLPETYGPVLLARRARRLQRDVPQVRIAAPLDLVDRGFRNMMTVVLVRPIRMMIFELIVTATHLYLSLTYAMFYMYFQAYPLIFQGIYQMSPATSSLMFLPIGLGACISMLFFSSYDSLLRGAKIQGKPWTRKEESRRLPLAYLGGPKADIHWMVPAAAGVPFGIGFVLIFMSLLNYLTDAYGAFAASAMAATGCCRSVVGAGLLFAATPMFEDLGKLSSERVVIDELRTPGCRTGSHVKGISLQMMIQ